MDTFADDTIYRAGLLIGREQSIADVMALLMDPANKTAADKITALLNWGVQSLEEGQAEAHLVAEALSRRPSEP